jgi:hypothetical protein
MEIIIVSTPSITKQPTHTIYYYHYYGGEQQHHQQSFPELIL